MIRFFLSKRLQHMGRFQSIMQPTHLFSSQKPGQQNKDQPQSGVNPEPSSHEKPKIKFGRQSMHPIHQMAEKHFIDKMKAVFAHEKKEKTKRLKKLQKFQLSSQMDAFRAMMKNKKDQKEEKDSEKSEAQLAQEKKRNLTVMFLGILFLISLSSNDQDENKQGKRSSLKGRFLPQQLNDFIYKQIETNQHPTKITISKNFDSPIHIRVNLTLTAKDIYTNEAGLAQFLIKLDQLTNNNIQIQFNFSPTTKKKDLKKIGQYINYAILAGVAFIIYKVIKRSSGGISEMFNMGKFQPVNPMETKVYFKDVAGMHQAKFQVTQFVDFLKHPQKYIEMGAKVPKGALLTGPPGTGKTLLAKACAGEAGVPFFSVSGSDFVQKYSGLGASRVRSLFDAAEKQAPSIIFIDQIDAIGKKRDSGPFSNEERDNTLNQLLVRMDGFDTKNKVIVIAATNRKDMLDPALLRPGRFDRSVQIGVPNFEQRKQILKVHLKKVRYDRNLTEEELSKKIAVITPGFSGAELANTCNQAAILAARQNLPQITLAQFEKATERVMAGLEKRNMFSDQEKEMLAIYQSGKAIASWFTQGSDPVIKISILPFSKSSSGFSHSIRDETALHTMDELLDKACCYLAGRASQIHFKGYVTTNGDKDLQRAKRIITMIVTKFGMSQSLKMQAFPDFDFIRKPYSQKVETLIDDQIVRISEECQRKVSELIKEKQKQIITLKEKLLQKQTLTHNCIQEILGERPFKSNENYQQFLKDQKEEQAKKVQPEVQ